MSTKTKHTDNTPHVVRVKACEVVSHLMWSGEILAARHLLDEIYAPDETLTLEPHGTEPIEMLRLNSGGFLQNVVECRGDADCSPSLFRRTLRREASERVDATALQPAVKPRDIFPILAAVFAVADKATKKGGAK
jgi:hypothetical protein